MTMRTPRIAALVVLACAWAAVCHPPRDARQVSESRVTGRWKAESAAVGEPADSGTVAWRVTLAEAAAGKVDGRGSRTYKGSAAAFVLSGQRGENDITLDFELAGQPVKYHGSIMGAKTIVGEMMMARDTLHVTFTKE